MDLLSDLLPDQYTKALSADLLTLRAKCGQTASLQAPWSVKDCLQAVVSQGVQRWEIMTLMLSLHVRSVAVTLRPKVRFTPDVAAQVKQGYPELGLQALLRLAVSEFDCMPEGAINGIGFRDRVFHVLGPYAVQITDSVDQVIEVDGMYRVFPVRGELGDVFKQQLSYALAYEYLFPASNPAMAKYSRATLQEFLQSIK